MMERISLPGVLNRDPSFLRSVFLVDVRVNVRLKKRKLPLPEISRAPARIEARRIVQPLIVTHSIRPSGPSSDRTSDEGGNHRQDAGVLNVRLSQPLTSTLDNQRRRSDTTSTNPSEGSEIIPDLGKSSIVFILLSFVFGFLAVCRQLAWVRVNLDFDEESLERSSR